MSYVDAFYDKKNDVVKVVERVDGKRLLIDHKPVYNFYVADPRGKQRSIYGDPVCELYCKNLKKFRKNVALYKHNGLFESDIKPLNKTIATYYANAEPPKLQTAFFDIEVDFDPARGYSSPRDAFMEITSIGVYLQWMDAMVCLAVPPKRITWEQAEAIADNMPEVILCRTEKEMLEKFL